MKREKPKRLRRRHHALPYTAAGAVERSKKVKQNKTKEETMLQEIEKAMMKPFVRKPKDDDEGEKQKKRRTKKKKLRASDEKKLTSIYTTPSEPYAFTGAKRFEDEASQRLGLDRERIMEWARGERSFTLNQSARTDRRLRTNPTFASGIGEQLQADLLDMSTFQQHNDGVRFLLTAVDVVSRFGTARALRSKNQKDVLEQLRLVFEHDLPSPPRTLQTDLGKEFYNKQVGDYLKASSVHHFSTQGDNKASMVERFNRTLKASILAWMRHAHSERYIDRLPEFVEAYNKRPHTSLPREKPAEKKLAPSEMNVYNQWRVVLPMLERMVRGSARRLRDGGVAVGDYVRLRRQKAHAFERSYYARWSEAIYRVWRMRANGQFEVEELSGEKVKGAFYPDEVQKVEYDPKKQTYGIEKIIKYRTRRGKREALVRWAGYSSEYDTWEPAERVAT